MTSSAYARVSTSDQSVQQQLDRLRTVAPGAVEYVDDAVSGRLDHRPAFDRLRAAIERGEVREVYVCKIDRLGRSAKGILEFFDLTESNGVRVVVADQGVDTSTPVGKVVRTILAALAELEADLIADRTREAMAAFKAGTRKTKSGKPVGRPRKLTEEVVAKVAELRAQGKRWREIALAVHIPTGTLRRLGTTLRRDSPHAVNPVASLERSDVGHEDPTPRCVSGRFRVGGKNPRRGERSLV